MRISLPSFVFAAAICFSSLGYTEPVSEGEEQSETVGRQLLDLSRQKNGNFSKKALGTLVIKNDWPHFETDDKVYRIETDDTNSQEQIEAARDGQNCEIEGKFLKEKDRLVVLVESFQAVAAETQTTDSGHVFTRDVSHPRSGKEVWIDESGMIWTDVARKKDGSLRPMTLKEAEVYCEKIQAKLPSAYPEELNGKEGLPNRDSDFVRLNKIMMATSEYSKPPTYFKAQVLPGLMAGGFLWSSTAAQPNPNGDRFAFRARSGGVMRMPVDSSGLATYAQCVIGD